MQISQVNRIRLVGLLFVLILGSVVYAADTGMCKRYFDFIRAFPLGDKVCHFTLMGIFSALGNLAVRCRTLGNGPLAPGVGTVVVTVFVVAEEISQIWIPLRTFELFDLTADFLGIACGAAIARTFSQRQKVGGVDASSAKPDA